MTHYRYLKLVNPTEQLLNTYGDLGYKMTGVSTECTPIEPDGLVMYQAVVYLQKSVTPKI